jgi:hypothetical protein
MAFPRGNAGITRGEWRTARAEEAVGNIVLRFPAPKGRFHVETRGVLVRVILKGPFPRGNAGITRGEWSAARAEEAVGNIVLRFPAPEGRFHVETRGVHVRVILKGLVSTWKRRCGAPQECIVKSVSSLQP